MNIPICILRKTTKLKVSSTGPKCFISFMDTSTDGYCDSGSRSRTVDRLTSVMRAKKLNANA